MWGIFLNAYNGSSVTARLHKSELEDFEKRITSMRKFSHYLPDVEEVKIIAGWAVALVE